MPQKRQRGLPVPAVPNGLEDGCFRARPRFPVEDWRAGPRADEFRSLDRLFARDPGQASWVILGEGSRGFREKTLEDHYIEIEVLKLGPGVPVDIRHHFDTARNLLLTGWFLAQVIPVAEFHAITSVEMALRERIGNESKRTSLRTLLQCAIDSGTLQADRFRQFRRRQAHLARLAAEEETEPQAPTVKEKRQFLETVANHLRWIRNHHAHAQGPRQPRAYRTLGLCSDTITQLFACEPVSAAPAKNRAVAPPQATGH